MTYAAICVIYSEVGTGFADKVIEYGGKALAFPVAESVARAIRLRVVWAKAEKVRGLNGSALYGAKRELIMLCVAGAALVGRNLDPLAEVPRLGVRAYDIGPATEAERKAINDVRQREVAGARAAASHNIAFKQFDHFVGFCAVAFKESGVTEDELKVVAGKAGCSEKVVECLMREVAKEKERK